MGRCGIREGNISEALQAGNRYMKQHFFILKLLGGLADFLQNT